MKLKIKLDANAVLPTRAHPTDAGLDLYATEDAWVYSGRFYSIDTGVHISIPEGYVGLLTSKSGLMKKGITSRGTIDSGYTGAIRVILFNDGGTAYAVHKGDKISQLVITPIITPEIEVVEWLEDTERGDNGFGSTGR